MHKFFSFLVLLLCSNSVFACIPQEWSLQRQFDHATKIALVEVIEAETRIDSSVIKAVKVKVISNIKNTAPEETINFVVQGVIFCDRVALNSESQQAIILMQPATSIGDSYFQAVNPFSSVYFVDEGMVAGIGPTAMSAEDAVKKVTAIANGSIGFGWSLLVIVVIAFSLVVIAIHFLFIRTKTQ